MMSDQEFIQLLDHETVWSSGCAVVWWAPTMEGFRQAVAWPNFNISLNKAQNCRDGYSKGTAAVPGVTLKHLVVDAVRSYSKLARIDMESWLQSRMFKCVQKGAAMLEVAADALLLMVFEDLETLPDQVRCICSECQRADLQLYGHRKGLPPMCQSCKRHAIYIRRAALKELPKFLPGGSMTGTAPARAAAPSSAAAAPHMTAAAVGAAALQPPAAAGVAAAAAAGATRPGSAHTGSYTNSVQIQSPPAATAEPRNPLSPSSYTHFVQKPVVVEVVDHQGRLHPNYVIDYKLPVKAVGMDKESGEEGSYWVKVQADHLDGGWVRFWVQLKALTELQADWRMPAPMPTPPKPPGAFSGGTYGRYDDTITQRRSQPGSKPIKRDPYGAAGVRVPNAAAGVCVKAEQIECIELLDD